ncbi:hypothetical protein V1264_017419 [Littorina saxatilis]|uniref:Immunoglobulin domain-containing protein n=2 Tax=Littorina saxatilis TaxID=31220 RepID=A0AAN9GF65_9CAEN
MNTLYFLAILLTLCLCATGSPGPGEEPITCKTSGTVLEGTAAEVTCDFHKDLNKTRNSFYVYRRTSGEAEIIVICEWNNADPKCRFVDDCVLKTASAEGKVTFQLPSAQQKHSGKYTCKTLPADQAFAANCDLTVKKHDETGLNPVSCHTSSPVSLGEDSSLFCMFSKNIGITGVTLEKYFPETGDTEEIVRCDKEESCFVPKEGYQVDQKTHSYLRVSLPGITADKAGIYFCISTAIKEAKGTCTIEIAPGEKSKKVSVLKQILTPLYAILACFLLLLILGIAALFQRSSCFLSRCYLDKGNGDSQESLMHDEKKLYV